MVADGPSRRFMILSNSESVYLRSSGRCYHFSSPPTHYKSFGPSERPQRPPSSLPPSAGKGASLDVSSAANCPSDALPDVRSAVALWNRHCLLADGGRQTKRQRGIGSALERAAEKVLVFDHCRPSATLGETVPPPLYARFVDVPPYCSSSRLTSLCGNVQLEIPSHSPSPSHSQLKVLTVNWGSDGNWDDNSSARRTETLVDCELSFGGFNSAGVELDGGASGSGRALVAPYPKLPARDPVRHSADFCDVSTEEVRLSGYPTNARVALVCLRKDGVGEVTLRFVEGEEGSVCGRIQGWFKGEGGEDDWEVDAEGESPRIRRV